MTPIVTLFELMEYDFDMHRLRIRLPIELLHYDELSINRNLCISIRTIGFDHELGLSFIEFENGEIVFVDLTFAQFKDLFS